MFGLRTPELLIILLVLVLMFGAKKIPDLGKALGKGIRSFKSATENATDDEPGPAVDAPAQAQLPERSATAKLETSEHAKVQKGA